MQRGKRQYGHVALFLDQGDPEGMDVTVSHKERVTLADLLWEICSGERVRKCTAGVTVSSCLLLSLTLCCKGHV